jgi:hypothetical protein
MFYLEFGEGVVTFAEARKTRNVVVAMNLFGETEKKGNF